MTNSDDDLMSQAEFARRVDLSKGRVTQLKTSGVLTADCFSPDGKKIRYSVAVAAINANRDPDQVVANGKQMPAADVLPLVPRSTAPLERSKNDQLIDQRIRKEKLQNEKLEEERRERMGMYVRAAEVAPIFADYLGQVVTGIKGELPNLSELLASEYELEPKTVRFFLNDWFRGVCERQTQVFEAMKDRLPEYVTDDVEEAQKDDNSPAINAAFSGDDCG